jgi:antitoxin PrlF
VHTTLTTKGQMTLPAAVRAQLGLEAGDQLQVAVVDADTIVLKRQPTAPATALRGLLGKPKRALSVDEMDAGIARHLGRKHRPAGKSR